MQVLVDFGKDREFVSPDDVIATVEPMVQELEERLAKARQQPSP